MTKKWDEIESNSASDTTEVDELVAFAEEVDLVSFLGSEPSDPVSDTGEPLTVDGADHASDEVLQAQAASLRSELDHPVDSFTEEENAEQEPVAAADLTSDADAAAMLSLLDDEVGAEALTLRSQDLSLDEMMAEPEELLTDADTTGTAAADLQPVLAPVSDPAPSKRGWLVVSLLAILAAMYGWSALHYQPTVPTAVATETVRDVVEPNDDENVAPISTADLQTDAQSIPIDLRSAEPSVDTPLTAEAPEVKTEPAIVPVTAKKPAAVPEMVAESKPSQPPVATKTATEPPVIAQAVPSQTPVPSVGTTESAVPPPGRFYLQIGAFVTPRYLQRAQAKVEAAGLPTWLASRLVEIPMYRVRVLSDALGQTPAIDDLIEQYPDAYTLKEWGKEVVYLGAFVNAENAEGLVRDYAELGGAAQVEKAATATELTILRAGGYPDREAADRQAKNLRTQGLQVLVVERR